MWSKIRKWLRQLEGRFEGKFRKGPPHPQELLPEILTHLEDKITPVGGQRQGFPFNLVRVLAYAPDTERQAVFAAVYLENDFLARQLRQRLREQGCALPAGLQVALEFASEIGSNWAHQWFDLHCEAATGARPVSGLAAKAFARATLTVLPGYGKTERDHYELDTPRRVNVGRLSEVRDAKGIPKRTNEVVFSDEKLNESVGREHAHLNFDEDTQEWRLYADSPRSNTNILRAGRTINVASLSRRGEKLFHGDVILCGYARLLFELQPHELEEHPQ